NAASFPKTMNSHLYFLIPLYKDFRPLKRINVFLSLSEINILRAVFFYKMVMLIPVIFVHIQGKTSLFLHTHHCRKLEETTLMLMGRRFADSYKPAAIINKFLYNSNNLLI